jgi:hypothetical protein
MAFLALVAAVSIGSARLCSRVENGACVGPVERAEVGEGPISFLTTLVGHEAGARVRHVWRRGGKRAAERAFTLGAPPTRVHSTQEVSADGPEWSVAVEDESGRELVRVPFRVVARRKLPPPERVPVEPPNPDP